MTDQPAPRARRSPADLSKLFDSLETPATADVRTTPLPARQSEATVETAAQAVHAPVRISPELQAYLPPDLWRNLSGENIRTGMLANALDRLNSLVYTISTYLPGDLVQEKLSRPVPGLVGGKTLSGCLLFSDVSGFTALSERLAVLGPQGAEHLTRVINQYFTAMIDIISWSNGTLLKFAGDATLIYFPEQPNGVHVQWAVRAGLRMLRAMKDFADLPTPLGPVTLSMKLGLAAGPFLAASIGSKKRMEYALIGSTVSQTLQSEGNSSPGNLVMNRAAADLLANAYPLSEIKPGFCLLQPVGDEALDEFEIRPAKRRARRSVPWDASQEDLAAQLDSTLAQLKSLTPYLASELVDRIIAHAQQRQVQSEYRPTAVMFCNFTGPEALLDAWGETGVSRVTGLLSAYFNEMNEAITRYGGIVSRIDPYSQGTKLLALFGAPVAHEDDPHRAVSAARAMNSALEDINRRWAQKLGRFLPAGRTAPLIEHRIGITLGETFAGQAGSSTRREYTVMGDDVNLSARLMSAAIPGQILISERIYERIDDYFSARALPPVRVKGKKKPIPIWQVDGLRENTLLTRIHNVSPLIGRQAEQERAWGLFQTAAAGNGTILNLAGPAGIGKSHLADTLLSRAATNGWQTLAFQCRSYASDEPYACWAGLIRSLAGIVLIEHHLIQLEKLEKLNARLGVGTAHASTLVDLLGLRSSQRAQAVSTTPEAEEDYFTRIKEKKTSRRASTIDVLSQLDNLAATASRQSLRSSDRELTRRQHALTAVVQALSASAPLVIFFEDVHWMDPMSRACLIALAKQTANNPVIFLQAGRFGENLPENGETIVLQPFQKEETTALVASILMAGLADIIHEQSDGSPLFVEEISRWIKGTYHFDAVSLRNALQSSDILQKLVLSNLESLPESQREVARLASIIGMSFQRSDVESLLGDTIDPLSLNTSLQSLVQARLITLQPGGEINVDPRYQFAQSITREVIYTSMSFERRRELHLRVAEYLKSAPLRRRQIRKKLDAFLSTASPAQTNVLEDAEKLAYHYEMSEQWLEAAAQLDQASQSLLDLGAPVEKILPVLTRALTLLEHYPPEKTTPEIARQKAITSQAMGDCAIRKGDLATAIAACESALAVITASDADFAFRLTARLTLLLPSQGRGPQAEKQLNAFLAQHPQMNDWRAAAVRAWLAWRLQRDCATLVAECREKLTAAPAEQQSRVGALLDDLSGDWPRAAETYARLGADSGAAMAHIRFGDHLLRNQHHLEAGQYYDLAAEIWQKQKSDCGLALVFYRRAELIWKTSDQSQLALGLLEDALSAVRKLPPALKTEPDETIQTALVRIKNRQPTAWPAWRWQPFDDLFRIQYLFTFF